MTLALQIVLFLYLILLLVLGYIGFRRGKSTEEDYYLAARGQGLIVTTLTIMATMFSSAAMLGIPGLVYKDGVAFVLFALNLPLSGACVYLLGSRISRVGRIRNYVTPGDLISDYYQSSTVLRILVAVVGFLYVLPYIIMQIKAGGFLAQRMFPDAGSIAIFGMVFDAFDLGVTILSLFTMVYVLIGGMRSVAWTDVIQGFLLLSGMLVAGIATIVAMGGITGFFDKVSRLPPEALSLPGASDAWTPWRLLTVCLFASSGTMIQPGQWIRYYAARSPDTLRRSAMIFSILLPVCFLFGIMLVALGGRALYPPSIEGDTILPHPDVGTKADEVDQIVIVMIQEHLPALLGPAGIIAVALMFVAILAASMSTADSNLHALSAVFTRDIYDRFVRPQASNRERTWIGRAVIVVVTILALTLVRAGRDDPDFKLLQLIGQLMFTAIAFSAQLLPVTLDILFIRKGTSAGAIAGIVTGLIVVFLFTPFPAILFGESKGLASLTGDLRRLFDIGSIGFLANAVVFFIVSQFTRPVPPGHRASFAKDMGAD